ncbi:MAG: biotin--[acetyl-CoA-carboxylase] ligase [Treponema sp.]|jgi:BirA family biotin operon repressor/biotin-[acetyl-CoA-carboxylase] ligase|nr:biotin--[acetyl-CoA-carboxylase] ligase [Treponema sp.]
MRAIPVANSFEGPVYFEETVSSTMDVSRRLAAAGAPHGTVIVAGFQEAGRGRTAGRPWLGDAGLGLFFTLLLRCGSFASIPAALALKAGLAVSLAVEDFAPPLAGLVRIKWPNDVLVLLPGGGRKIAGILCESDGSDVFVGIGVNTGQAAFPPGLERKATSLNLALAELGPGEADGDGAGPAVSGPGGDPRFALLELILNRLRRELDEDPPGASESRAAGPLWRERLEERLYMKGRRVRFIAGEADSGRPVEGLLRGVGPGGELVILPGDGGRERSFVTGELDLYG